MKTMKMIVVLVLALGFPDVVIANWVISGDDMYADVSGNVGIGTTDPVFKLDVAGSARVSLPSSGNWTDFRINDSTGLAAFFVQKDGIVGIGTTIPESTTKLHVVTDFQDYSARAVFAESRWGYGVFGKCADGKGLVGVSGGGKDPTERRIDELIGVYGDANDCGVYGISTDGTGGHFVAESYKGRAVYGSANAQHNIGAENYGGYFTSSGQHGIGVFGEATYISGPPFTGKNYGGYFQAGSPTGVGAYAENTYTGNYGSLGTSGAGAYGRYESNENSGTLGAKYYGVYGWSQDSCGVKGESLNGKGIEGASIFGTGGYFTTRAGTGYAVFGRASGAGNVRNFGGWFEAEGDDGVGVYGTAWTGTGGHFAAPDGYGVIAEGDTGVRAYGRDYDFFAAGPGTNYGSSSSIRWKTNIQLIDGCLNKVLNLRGVYFDWDEDHGGRHDVGMIAEEVGEIMPELVKYEQDGVYAIGMDYTKLTPFLVEAIKELKDQIDEQQKELVEKDARIAEFEQINKSIQARLAAIEAVAAKHKVWHDGIARLDIK